MSLVTFDNVTLSFGDQPLLNKASFNIEANDKICLLGRNGEGKSSLLKLILQPQNIDSGNIRFNSKINIGYLDQHLPEPSSQTVYEYIATALTHEQQLLQQFEQISQSSDTHDLALIENLQQQIDALDAWDIEVKINKVINLLELPKQKLMNELSGGWRRRVALGKALVNNPELLLLDEPTNHLDILAINWLKKCMQQFNGALLFITHDRDFLRSTANSLLDLDRGNLTSWQCDYQTYLTRKAELLATEQQHNALFDKKLAKEEVWIRQGIKARRTRNEGRVRKLKALRQERQQRRLQQGGAKFTIGTNQNSGKLVIEAKNISYAYENQPIVKDFSFRLMRGDKVGLIGANGVGKSTLIKLLLGQLKPQSGSVTIGSNLDIAYFDQQRSQLNLARSVIDNLAEGQTEININGKTKHVIGYLGDFLFSPQRCQVPVKVLSGGERNRLLLARLFSKSANFLVLDEPTNDLDVETLELLESLLVDFTGTVLLVSHDTEFLNNTVSSNLVFYPHSQIKEYVGGFNDWISQGGDIEQLTADKTAVKKGKNEIKGTKTSVAKQHKTTKKLSYKLKLELEQLPDDIEKCETELEKLQQITEQPDFYNREAEYTQSIWQQITKLQQEIEQKLQRWQELDDLSSGN